MEEAGITSVLYDSFFLTGLLESQMKFPFFLSFNLGLEIIKRYFANLQVQFFLINILYKKTKD